MLCCKKWHRTPAPLSAALHCKPCLPRSRWRACARQRRARQLSVLEPVTDVNEEVNVDQEDTNDFFVPMEEDDLEKDAPGHRCGEEAMPSSVAKTAPSGLLTFIFSVTPAACLPTCLISVGLLRGTVLQDTLRSLGVQTLEKARYSMRWYSKSCPQSPPEPKPPDTES